MSFVCALPKMGKSLHPVSPWRALSFLTFQATTLHCNLGSLVSLIKSYDFVDHTVFSYCKGGYDVLSSLPHPKQN